MSKIGTTMKEEKQYHRVLRAMVHLGGGGTTTEIANAVPKDYNSTYIILRTLVLWKKIKKVGDNYWTITDNNYVNKMLEEVYGDEFEN